MASVENQQPGHKNTCWKYCSAFWRCVNVVFQRIGFADLWPATKCTVLSVLALPSLYAVFLIWVFLVSIVGMHLFSGLLQHKCVLARGNGTEGLSQDVQDQQSELTLGEAFVELDLLTTKMTSLCGSEPGSWKCQSSESIPLSCQMVEGSNPDYGYTSFDTLGWSYLTSLRVATQDFWESVFAMAMLTKGYWCTGFFVFTIVTCYPLLGMFLAVIMEVYVRRQKIGWLDNLAHTDDKQNNLEELQPEGGLSRTSSRETESSGCSRCLKVACLWDCSPCWMTVSQKVASVIFNPFVEIGIAVLLILNVLVMVAQHDGMEEDLLYPARIFNWLTVALFILEALLKLIALSPKNYFQGWNIFELVVIIVGVTDICLDAANSSNPLPAFRVLRIVRMARFWPTLNLMWTCLGNSLCTQLQFLFFLVGVAAFWGWAGQFMYGDNYIKNRDRFVNSWVPHWNLVDHMHSFMLVFRAMCGEWVETLYDCLLVSGWSCLPFFMALLFVGRFLLTNVFIAFTVASLHTLNLDKSSKDQTILRLSEAVDQIVAFLQKVRERICWSPCCHPVRPKNSVKIRTQEMDETVTLSLEEVLPEGKSRAQESSGANNSASLGLVSVSSEIIGPPDCFPSDSCCFRRSKPQASLCCTLVRGICLRAAQSEIMEFVVLIVVIIGCTSLVLRDFPSVQEQEGLRNLIYAIDIIVSCLFVLEMTYKMVAYGCWHFFRSGWRSMELVIVVIVFLNMLSMQVEAQEFRIFHSLLALRLLRVLRCFLYFQSFREVLNALLISVPGLVSTVMLSSVVWLVFAVLGMGALSGKFHLCADQEGNRVHYSQVPDKETCLQRNLTWVNPSLTFDNIFHSALSFFHVGTFSGWIRIMKYGVDTKEDGDQPADEVSLHKYINFLLFVVQMSFFVYTILLGVLLDGFNRMRTLTDGSSCVRPEDQIFKRAISYVRGKELEPTSKPNAHFRVVLHGLVSSSNFDWLVAACVVSGVVVMSAENLQNSETARSVLHAAYIVLVVLLSCEVLVRVLASSSHLLFLRKGTNCLDGIILFLTIYDLASHRFVSGHLLPPLLLRMARLVQIVWVQSWFRCFHRLRCVRLTLSRSASRIASLYLLVALLILVFAVAGQAVVSSLGAVPAQYNRVFNFRSMSGALALMFQISTTAGWDESLQELRQELGCEKDESNKWSCGNAPYAPVFLISFVVVTYVILSAVLVILIEKYQETCDDVALGLAQDDLDDFYRTFAKYQKSEGPEFIAYKDLSNFLDSLPASLRLAKPNSAEIALMDLPIYSGQYMHHRDVLEQLIRKQMEYSGWKANTEEEVPDQSVEVVSTTLWMAHQVKCVRTIESAWISYKRQTREVCCSCAH